MKDLRPRGPRLGIPEIEAVGDTGGNVGDVVVVVGAGTTSVGLADSIAFGDAVGASDGLKDDSEVGGVVGCSEVELGPSVGEDVGDVVVVVGAGTTSVGLADSIAFGDAVGASDGLKDDSEVGGVVGCSEVELGPSVGEELGGVISGERVGMSLMETGGMVGFGFTTRVGEMVGSDGEVVGNSEVGRQLEFGELDGVGE